MSKKGVTLIELLAAVIIFGLAISLTATVITMLNNASDKIEINAQANSEGLFIDRALKDAILDFSPTTYSKCGGQDCFVLEKEFAYEFDPILEEIILTTYTPALTHQIEINNGEILVNDNALIINNFTLGSGTTIDVITSGTQAYLTIMYELVASTGEVFTFTTSFSFAILTIPA